MCIYNLQMDVKGNFNPAAAVQSIQDELKDAAKPNIYACYEQSYY